MTDTLHRFTFDGLPMRGQWVRLQGVLADATANRKYPDAISELLAKQLAAVSMFADSLKFQGAVALQSKGDGALIRSLAECREQHKLRGIAHLDEELPLPGDANLSSWLGNGQLALSLIDQESGQMLHQGMIELAHADLATNLEHYFAQSEQLPTLLFFALTEKQTKTETDASVTGLLLQRLPEQEDASEVQLDLHENAWHTACTLAATLEPAELANLEPTALLRRLFAEFHCRLHPPRNLAYACTCSRGKSDRTLLTLSDEELDGLLVEQTTITVDCEFCAERYHYDAVDIGALKANR